jgi:O-antigen ligase
LPGKNTGEIRRESGTILLQGASRPFFNREDVEIVMGTSAATGFRLVAVSSASPRKVIRFRDWFQLSVILSFVAGLLTHIQFQFGGRTSCGELVLAVVAVFAVMANVGHRRFWDRRVLLTLFALFVTFAGYIISDLVNATPEERLIRGWARIAFVIIDFIAIWSLVRKSLVSLFAICLGVALSLVLTYGAEQGSFLTNYKVHLAVPLTVAVMIAIPSLMPRQVIQATGLSMILVGMLHIWLDSRMVGAICMVIGFVLIARYITTSRLRSLYLVALVLALISASVGIAYVYVATNPEFATRREGSNSERKALALAGISAIERSPVIGLGSWSWDTEMWNVFSSRLTDRSGYMPGEKFGVHSQILQSWAEAGLLGTVFFIYYGRLLFHSLWILFFRRPLDIMTPTFLYFILVACWDLLFSPFANLHRFYIGLSLAIAIQVLRERNRSLHAADSIFPASLPVPPGMTVPGWQAPVRQN